MSWFYNLLYATALLLSSPWLVWRAWRQGKNRRGWGQKLFGLSAVPPKTKPRRLWLHAVSVGEVNLLAPIIERIESQAENSEIVISTTTETGYDLACRKYGPRPVFFFPFDFSWAVRNALRRVNPNLIVLAELEIWPNLLAASRKAQIPVAVINGRLSGRSFRGYRLARWLAANWFRKLSLVVAQNETYAARFRELGISPDRIRIAGNVKFDNASPRNSQQRAAEIAHSFSIHADSQLLIGGSTQFDEDQMLVSCFAKLRKQFPKLRLVLVPRHPQRSTQLVNHIERRGLNCELRSQAHLKSIVCDHESIVVVDVIGELAAWWSHATIAYVGGSLGSRGGQNMIEPAACGKIVTFGPRTENFKDVVELLLGHEAAIVIRREQDLYDVVCKALTEKGWAQDQGRRAREIVESQRGAADFTASCLLGLEQRSVIEPAKTIRAA